jgi:hypothetical protein
MRRSLIIAALLCTTALVPSRADAGPVAAFFTQFAAGLSGGGALIAGGAVVGGALGSSAFLAGSFFGSSLIGKAVFNLALSFGLSAIARKLGPKPPRPTPIERIANFAQPITLMDWVFGRVRKGGPYAVTSFQVDRRHYAVILAAHEIAGVDQWYIDNQPVTVDAGLVDTPPFAPYIGLRPYLGAPGQTADATLLAAIPEWTSAHNLAGLAYVAAFARRVPDAKFSEVYGNSSETGPVITPVIRGVKVYDPRTSLTGYSNNAALVWAWATENRLGSGTVDWAEVAVEADVADVLVTNRLGGTQRKWTLNGAFTDDTDYSEIAEQIIAACDGYVYEKPDGTVGFKVGRYIEPTVTLTEADFYAFDLAERDWGPNPATEYVAQYVEPANDYLEAISGTLVVDPDAETNRQSVQLLYVDSHNQAIRALKRIARAARAQFTLSGTIGPVALDLMRDRFVRVDVLGREFVAEIGTIRPGADDVSFQIELSSVVPADFAFNAATEEPAPPPRDKVTNDNAVPAPSGLAGSAIAGPGIEWTWTAQREDLNQEFRFREVGAADWQPVVTIRDEITDLITPGLVDGTDYEAELSNVTAARRRSAWVPFGIIRAVANPVAPDPVDDFTATGGAGLATLDWTTANDPLHVSTRLYRTNGSTDFADAVLIATVFGAPNTGQSYGDTLSPGNYVYWAASANASGVESATEGPETATVT